MKHYLLPAAAALFIVSGPAFAGDLKISVTGVIGGAGQVGCGLHKTEDSFPMGHRGVETVWVKPQGTGAVCLFKNLAPGVYAVAVAHDLNGNRKTDTNFLGLPNEAWGVSGNVRPAMRAPKFSEAAFRVENKSVSLTIEVK